MRILLESIGCRLNMAELDDMASHFVQAGHRIVGPGDMADLVVFNSCAVTHAASRKSRQVIRRLRRSNPVATIVATGCHSDLSPNEVKNIGVDVVVSNALKHRLPSLLDEAGIITPGETCPENPEVSKAWPHDRRRTRAFVKVQDGCDNRCTFCIVTVARGPARSRSVQEILCEINSLVDAGYQEVVLTGVHLGSFGHDNCDQSGLMHLVQATLANTDIPRLRLSSLEPWDIGDDFFKLWSNERLLPHIHLPLQSGCDTTLRRMARRTTKASYAQLVDLARTAVPDLSITTDVIVAFPGETESDFEESIAFIEQLEFAKLHIFRYSPRNGTAAASMRNHVAPDVAHERSQRMHALDSSLQIAFHKKFLGRLVPVLWETSENSGPNKRWSGLTGNYVRVLAQASPHADLHNKVTKTRLLRTIPGAVIGSRTSRDMK